MSNHTATDSQLKKLLAIVKWDSDGLIPAIVQDIHSREVLMLAYMDQEALKKTIIERKACYYSRSRQSLWVKGETSGNYQEVVNIRFDCDQDAVLLLVKQTGVACHENYYSCFHYEAVGINDKDEDMQTPNKPETDPVLRATGRPDEIPPLTLGRNLELLNEVIRKRKRERPEGAYTTYLFTKGIDKILKKVGEECAEVIIAAKNDSKEEIKYEVADLFYHLLVMLEDKEVPLQDIALELESRRK